MLLLRFLRERKGGGSRVSEQTVTPGIPMNLQQWLSVTYWALSSSSVVKKIFCDVASRPTSMIRVG